MIFIVNQIAKVLLTHIIFIKFMDFFLFAVSFSSPVTHQWESYRILHKISAASLKSPPYLWYTGFNRKVFLFGCREINLFNILLTGVKNWCTMKTRKNTHRKKKDNEPGSNTTTTALQKTIFNQFIRKSCEIRRRNWFEIFQRYEFSYT